MSLLSAALLGLSLLAPARADTFWELEPAAADQLQAALHKGDLLVRLCPGCGGEAVVFSLRGLEQERGQTGEGRRLRMRWRGVATGVVGDSLAVPPLACVPREAVCMADPQQDCAGRQAVLDVPYTFVLRDGSWVWVGALAELPAPGPDWSTPLPATRNHRRIEKSCRAMRAPTPRPGRPGAPDGPPRGPRPLPGG
jgi:hypothetical protein